MLRKAGLIGGDHPPAASALICTAVVWTTLDSGRIATDLSRHGYKGLKKRLLRFQMGVLREILNLSHAAPTYAVIGELAMMTDPQREETQILHALRRMLTAPSNSIPAQLIRTILQAARQGASVPFVERTTDLMAQKGVDSAVMMKPTAKNQINRRCWDRAEEDWRNHVRANRELAMIYPEGCPFATQGYLELDAFKGRTLLTRLRANDLPLYAAGYNTKSPKLCPCCGRGLETRIHFLLGCLSLRHVRDTHSAVPGLMGIAESTSALRELLLCHHIPTPQLQSRARILGAFLDDLWRARGLIIGTAYQRFYP